MPRPDGELDCGCNPRLNKHFADAPPNSELVILDGLKNAILIETSTVRDREGHRAKARGRIAASTSAIDLSPEFHPF